MDKNRMEGRYGTTSWHNTAKSSGLPVEVNAVVVQGRIVPLLGEIWREGSGQKSADAIVVGETSRSAHEHVKIAGSLTQRRAELHGGRPNRVADGQSTDDARRRGGAECRHDGKHVGAQGRASACSSRGLVPRLCGTAVYGPVRTVVWDSWLALGVSHGDPIRRPSLFDAGRDPRGRSDSAWRMMASG